MDKKTIITALTTALGFMLVSIVGAAFTVWNTQQAFKIEVQTIKEDVVKLEKAKISLWKAVNKKADKP